MIASAIGRYWRSGLQNSFGVLCCVAALASGCDSGPPRGAPADADRDSIASGASEEQARQAYSNAARAADSIAHASVSERERFGGTIVVSGRNDIQTLNPLVATDMESVQHQAYVLFTPLVRAGPDFEPTPWLAREWSIDPEGDRVTFYLRDDVYWHDGVPVTAADVAFTWERVVDPEVPFFNPAYFDAWEAVEVLDEHTVRFTVRPRSNLLYGWAVTAILPEHILGDVPPADLASHPFGTVNPVGSGPFRFVERVPGDRWIFEANLNFPEALGGRPYADRLIYRQIPEDAVAEAALRTGEIDMIVDADPGSALRLAQDSSLVVSAFPSAEYSLIAWNTRREPFGVPEVRRALTLAIDREAIARVVRGGYGSVSAGPVGPWHWAWDSARAPLPFDPDSARALLEAAGWADADSNGVREKDGRELRFELYSTPRQAWRDVGTIVQANLAEVGVVAEPRVREQAALIPLVTSPDRRFDAFLVGWSRDVPLDDRDLWACDRVDDPMHFTGWCLSDLDAILDSMQVVSDRSDLGRLIRRYEALVADAQPYTFLFNVETILARRASLHGVEADARGTWASVSEWWIDPESRR
jgi:peptide/nickel transport system substrate-binding protein